MYIDTEGTFRPERLLAVAERRVGTFSFFDLFLFYEIVKGRSGCEKMSNLRIRWFRIPRDVSVFPGTG